MIEAANKEQLEELTQLTGVNVPWEIASRGDAWAIVLGGDLVAVIGCERSWEAHGQTWAVVDHEQARRHAIGFTREARRLLHEKSWEHDYRQVRAMCWTLPDIKWAELLGFQLEGVWKDAGPQFQDIFIMVYHRRQ